VATFEVDINDAINNYELKDNEGFKYCLFEAISNSLYCCLNNNTDINISINLYRTYAVNEIRQDNENYIQAFTIIDNGVGFTDENYDKFTKKMYKTNHEGGKGLGRLSFLKVFDDVKITSGYREGVETILRKFSFSRNEIKDSKNIISTDSPVETIIEFSKIKSIFQENTKKSIDYYCNEVLRHFYIFLYYLLENERNFEIKFIDDIGKISEQIINAEKLKKDKVFKDSFSIRDKAVFDGMNEEKFEIVHIKTKNIGDNKAFYIVDERSAGEISNIDLPPGILRDESGFDYHYYMYLKSQYFNRFLSESRTLLSLPSKKSESDNIITVESIEQIVRKKINQFLEYETGVLEQKKEAGVINVLTDLRNNRISNNKAFLYMLQDDRTKKELLDRIKYNDSDNSGKVLTKVREFHEELQEATIAKINGIIEKLKSDKDDIDFAALENEIRESIEKVNVENLVNLSSYIMYRKYILNLFKERLNYAKTHKTRDESFFHNLLLPKGESNIIDSNLWLFDELFLYFDGASEASISDVTINGKRIIRDLTAEESAQLEEFNKKRMKQRIDMLFFPEEKKCVIIELKDPKIGVTENVFQMDRYVTLLANFIKPEFSIENFFTYLVTDNFNKYDKPGTGYRKMYGIDGFVRTSADVKDYESDLTIANQYSEVIRYTDIYERAHKRNKIFFNKMNRNKTQA